MSSSEEVKTCVTRGAGFEDLCAIDVTGHIIHCFTSPTRWDRSFRAYALNHTQMAQISTRSIDRSIYDLSVSI